MAELTGFTQLLEKLLALAGKERAPKTAVTGFTAAYAVHVHEDTQARHTTGQAKFLEQPARERAKEIGTVYSNARKQGMSHEQAILLAALYLQGEAQKLCPVLTGALRASAFTELEETK